jgi:hypothetical protein
VSGKQVAGIIFAREGGSNRRLEKIANVKFQQALTISNSISKDEMDGHVVYKEEKNNSKKLSSTNLKH